LAVYQKGHDDKDALMTQTDHKHLPLAAPRALAEAEARRIEADKTSLPPELGGRKGPEPVRYGDWERKGIAVDF
jgi:hypothetical protein